MEKLSKKEKTKLTNELISQLNNAKCSSKFVNVLTFIQY